MTFKDRIITALGFSILSLIYRTIRWSPAVPDERFVNILKSAPVIFVFWHGHQLGLPWIYKQSSKLAPNIPMTILSSKHRDGRLIATVAKYFNIENIAGSSSKGGATALRGLLECLKNRGNIAITPDGPKGPIYEIKDGVLVLAQATGAPIYPMTVISDRYWQFNSWDKMQLPKPWAKVHWRVGEPIYISQTDDLEEKRREIKNALDNLRNQT